MPAALSLSLVGGGLDTANIGTGSGVQSIFSPLAITDPPSFIAVKLNDGGNTTSSRFVTLSSAGGVNTITGLDPSTITAKITDLTSLALSGGGAGNTFVVSGVTGPTGNSFPVTINTGTGVDSTFIQGDSTGTSIALHGQSGADGVAVSNAGSVQGLAGPVSVDNLGGSSALVVDDSNDATGRTSTMAESGGVDTISGVAPSNITATAADLSTVTLDGGSGGNTMTLSGLGASGTVTLNTGTGADTIGVPAVTNLGTLNINGQSGHDVVNLGGTGGSGSVQHLGGPVSVTNGGTTALAIDDAADTSSRAVTLGTTAVTGLAPAPINYAGVSALTVDGGAPSDSFAVSPSATTPVTLVGGGPLTGALPGNTLAMDLSGASAPVLGGSATASGVSGSWTFGNRSPVAFSNMQSLDPTALSIGDASTTVGGSGSSPLPFSATLLAPSTQPVSASYATADGTATAASGAYQPSSGTVTIPAGTPSGTIAITAFGQPVVRPPQTLSLTLTNPVNAVLARSTGTGTITDSYVTPPPAGPAAPGPAAPGPAAPGPAASVRPVLTRLTQTHARWREGNALALISSRPRSRAPVGTIFSLRLSEAARLSLIFDRAVAGRSAHGRCVAETTHNRHGRTCRLVIAAGPLAFNGHAGTNKIAFQGRLSRRARLKLGRYDLQISAVNTAGQRSTAGTLAFTIVK